MRSKFFILAVIVIFPKLLLADNPGMRFNELLATNSIEEFVVCVESNHLNAPLMPSQWFISTVTQESSRERLTTARSFGESLLKRLDSYSTEVVVKSDLSLTERQADILLRLACWIGSVEGYGNTIIASRVQDLATVAVGRLVVNTNYPMAKVLSLVDRFGGKWYGANSRAAVLDEEIGEEVFAPVLAKESADENALANVWIVGFLKNAEKKKKIPLGFELRGVDTNIVNGTAISRHLGFFLDSTPVGDLTTLERWNLKQHERFVWGVEASKNMENLRMLARFRELIGFFPASVPYKNHPFHTQSEAAFEYVWRPHRKKEGPIYGVAASMYESIQDGEFLDQDTWIQHTRAKETEEVQ